MDFSTAVNAVFSKYADFEGRARRSEYWYSVLFNAVISFGMVFLGLILGAQTNAIEIGIALFGLYWLAVILPSLAVSVRRFHDLNQTGWLVLAFAFAGLIPLVRIVSSIAQLI